MVLFCIQHLFIHGLVLLIWFDIFELLVICLCKIRIQIWVRLHLFLKDSRKVFFIIVGNFSEHFKVFLFICPPYISFPLPNVPMVKLFVQMVQILLYELSGITVNKMKVLMLVGLWISLELFQLKVCYLSIGTLICSVAHHIIDKVCIICFLIF